MRSLRDAWVAARAPWRTRPPGQATQSGAARSEVSGNGLAAPIAKSMMKAALSPS